MRVVYRAQHTKLKRTVALKFLSANLLRAGEKKTAFSAKHMAQQLSTTRTLPESWVIKLGVLVCARERPKSAIADHG